MHKVLSLDTILVQNPPLFTPFFNDFVVTGSSFNLKRVKITFFNIKYAAFKNIWREKIYTYFLNLFFWKENKQSPEIWQCCFYYYFIVPLTEFVQHQRIKDQEFGFESCKFLFFCVLFFVYLYHRIYLNWLLLISATCTRFSLLITSKL